MRTTALSACALLLLLTALAARGDDEPGDPPAGLVSAPPPGATHAFFVRVTGALLGGNFDSADVEEVEVRALVGDRAVRLAWRALDLPADEVAPCELPGTAWVELPPPPVKLDLEARDEDLTEWELITATASPLALEAADFGPEPRARTVETTTIRLEEGGFLRATRRVVIEGPALEVELVSAPRRDAKDAGSAALMRAAFASLLEAPADVSAATGAALAARLESARAGVLARAGASLHTYARRRAPALAQEAGAVGDDARCLAAADPAALRERLRPLRGVAPLDPLLAEIDAALASAPPDDAALERWEQHLGRIAGEVMFADGAEQEEALRQALKDVRRGRRLRAAEVDARWKALRRAIEAELAP